MTLLPARAANHWDNWLTYRLAGVLCRRFRRHTLHCRSRSDHVRDGRIIDPGRWLP